MGSSSVAVKGDFALQIISRRDPVGIKFKRCFQKGAPKTLSLFVVVFGLKRFLIDVGRKSIVGISSVFKYRSFDLFYAGHSSVS